MMQFRGMPVVTSWHLTVPAEDWTWVRSPSRARRRLKQGHRQNVRHYQRPSPDFLVVNGTIHCHPARLLDLQRRLQDESNHL